MARMTLENWAICQPYDEYTAPELRRDHLEGIPDHHPRLGGGRTILTSAIVKGAVEDDGTIVVTTLSGSIYALGKVSEEYERMYPNAKQRLIARIEQLNSEM